MFKGGEMFKIWGFELFFKWGKQSFEHRKVPLVLIECIKSYLFMSSLSVGVKEIALALLMRISIPPKVATVLSIAACTLFSSQMSHEIGRALPPAFSISAAAEKIVPGSFGFGSVVFAMIATLAPKD